jgi:hypothetical protein
MKKLIFAVLAATILAASLPSLANHNRRHCPSHPNSPDCRP